MVTLPKILYIFQMLPIEIPQCFFKIIKTIILKYIWQNKKARVNIRFLYRKKKKGGYYTAVILARLVEWVNTNTKKQWVKTEDTFSMTQLQKNIWIPPKFRADSTDTHDLNKNVFKVWDTLHRKEK